MAGKHSSSITLRTRSRLLLFLLSPLPLSLLFYTISLFTSPRFPPAPLRSSPNPNPSADYSFVASLEIFLSLKPRGLLDDAVASASEQDVKKLDDMIWKTETERLYGYPFLPPLRVYVYEMPKKFTYDLLTLFQNTYRETSNLTSNGSPVHRLIEQARAFAETCYVVPSGTDIRSSIQSRAFSRRKNVYRSYGRKYKDSKTARTFDHRFRAVPLAIEKMCIDPMVENIRIQKPPLPYTPYYIDLHSGIGWVLTKEEGELLEQQGRSTLTSSAFHSECLAC